MAKKKGPRIMINLRCRECGKITYPTEKNRNNTKDKLVLRKFCPKCRKHTEHIEEKFK